MDTAAWRGMWREVRWLGLNCPERSTAKSVHHNGLCGNLEMVQFLMLHCNVYCDRNALEVIYIYDKDEFAIPEWLL